MLNFNFNKNRKDKIVGLTNPISHLILTLKGKYIKEIILRFFVSFGITRMFIYTTT